MADEPTPETLHVILLIHGIRTHAQWMPMVCEKLEIPGKVVVIPIKYGKFDAIRFWCPFWTRTKPTSWVHEQIRNVRWEYREIPNLRLSIIAHSFGTYIVSRILRNDYTIRIHKLIMCGSVVRNDFEWEQIRERFDPKETLNECSNKDIWPVLARRLSWGYGDSGTYGFYHALIKNRFHEGRHSQYLEPTFVDRYWVPFMISGDYQPTRFEQTKPPIPWSMRQLDKLRPKNVAAMAMFLLAVPVLSVYLTMSSDITLNAREREIVSGAHPRGGGFRLWPHRPADSSKTRYKGYYLMIGRYDSYAEAGAEVDRVEVLRRSWPKLPGGELSINSGGGGLHGGERVVVMRGRDQFESAIILPDPYNMDKKTIDDLGDKIRLDLARENSEYVKHVANDTEELKAELDGTRTRLMNLEVLYAE